MGSRHEFPRRLTEEQVRWVKAVIALDRRERKALGMRRGTNGLHQRLAKHLGVSVWCIESIARKKRWRNVPAKDWRHRSTT